LLSALIATFVIWLGQSRHANASRLSKYLIQLRAKGEKLTFAELAIPPSTNPAEAASRAVFTNTSFEDPDIKCIMMQYTSPGRARVAWRGHLLIESTNEGEASALGDWEELSASNGRTAQKLGIFREALNFPTPDNGWIYEDTFANWMAARPRTPRLARQIGRTLANTVIGDLHDGNKAGALTNVCALAALANLCRNNLEILNILVRSANAKDGLDATWEALQAPGWSEAQLSELQDSWASLDTLNGLERSVEAERSGAMVKMEELQNWKLPEMVNGFTINDMANDGTLIRPSLKERFALYIACANYKARWLENDELGLLEYWTAFADAARELENGKPAAEALQHMDAASKKADIAYAQMSSTHRMIGVFLIPFKLTGSVQRIVETEAQRRLSITAIAIKRYELKQGTLPRDLEALVPEFLTAVPMDPMSGKPLCYRLNTDGTFVLYSTGEDGVDDGGDPRPRNGGTSYGLWEGRDAVWPVAASAQEEAAWEATVEKNAGAGTR
jgi:hypothetical protein